MPNRVASQPSRSLDPLNALIQSRSGGAVNIRGIRYQILYSIHKTLTLFSEDAATSVRLEGAEDFDSVSCEYGNRYVQVKSRRTGRSWTIRSLDRIFASFLDVLRIDDNAAFIIALDESLTGPAATLFAKTDHPNAQALKTFRDTMRVLGASPAETDRLQQRIKAEIESEDELESSVLSSISSYFSAGHSEAVALRNTLTSYFLEWSAAKRNISKQDFTISIDEARRTLAEVPGSYRAFTRNLIDTVNWDSSESTADYYAGVSARPEHISANMDVPREEWLNKIDTILSGPKPVCILRAASGQGKSTIAYRYAYDHWNRDSVLQVRKVQNHQDTEDIRAYLEDQARVGRVFLILIEELNLATHLWADIAQVSRSTGHKFLAAVRHEDWALYGHTEKVEYEPVEPELSLGEARRIYGALRFRGDGLSPNAPSPEEAYEQLGKPALLLEYIFLITQGGRIEERLRKQIQLLSTSSGGSAKRVFLKRVAMAHSLGASLSVLEATEGIEWADDLGASIAELCDEFIRVESDSTVTGLHWVRSERLTAILHETLNDEHVTALSLIHHHAVPPNHLPHFIATSLIRPSLDSERFYNGLIRAVRTLSPLEYLGIVEGVYRAGELDFLLHCRPLLEEANARSWGLRDALAGDLSPMANLDTVGSIATLLGEHGKEAGRISNQSKLLREQERGEDAVLHFLTLTAQKEIIGAFGSVPEQVGRLLHWFAVAQTTSSHADRLIERVLTQPDLLHHVSPEGFSRFSEGLYRYDPTRFLKWFDHNRDQILAYLRLQLDCSRINVNQEEDLYCEFIADQSGSASLNDQAMRRLRLLRMAIPHCNTYRTQGLHVLPFNAVPSVDDTTKSIPRKNLPPESDIRLNRLWIDIVNWRFTVDSIYSFQSAWYESRRLAIEYTRRLVNELDRHGTGILPKALLAMKASGSTLDQLDNALRTVPPMPGQVGSKIQRNFQNSDTDSGHEFEFDRVNAQKWLQALRTYLHLSRKYNARPSMDTGRANYWFELGKIQLSTLDLFIEPSKVCFSQVPTTSIPND